MTVLENLQMGASLDNQQYFDEDVKLMFDLFPRLKERINQRGGTLSGGEQQMLAIARALMARPKLLLLDEPSLGLAPLIVKQIFEAIKELNRTQGLTVFPVEQNAFGALKLADRGYVMVNGSITMSGSGRELCPTRKCVRLISKAEGIRRKTCRVFSTKNRHSGCFSSSPAFWAAGRHGWQAAPAHPHGGPMCSS